MTPIENFESIASALYDEAPSDKARAFCLKVVSAIRERGEEWIVAHADALHIKQSAQQLESVAPVEDNRLWFMAEWQKALHS